MEISNSTIVVTGGSSGIGLEMCKRFMDKGNVVIACSRSLDKLKRVQQQLPNLVVYQCDIGDEKQCNDFAEWIRMNYPEAAVLVNNAAISSSINFVREDFVLDKLQQEMATNLIAPIRLIKLLYPVLLKNKSPKIINITTGLVYVPRVNYVFYNATKAALHSFTQVLREQLKNEKIQIIEVLFPAVDTPWHKGNPPKSAIPVEKAVSEMVKAISQGKLEIRISKVKLLYLLSRIAPKVAFKKVNSLN